MSSYQSNIELIDRLAGNDNEPAQHNDHCITRAMHRIIEALSDGADHDSHVFARLMHLATLPKEPEEPFDIPGLVVIAETLRAARAC